MVRAAAAAAVVAPGAVVAAAGAEGDAGVPPQAVTMRDRATVAAAAPARRSSALMTETLLLGRLASPTILARRDGHHVCARSRRTAFGGLELGRCLEAFGGRARRGLDVVRDDDALLRGQCHIDARSSIEPAP